MDTKARPSRIAVVSVLAADALALAALYLFLPSMRRPLEVCAGVILVLSIVTAVVLRRPWQRNLLMILASLAGTVFALELAEKTVNLTARFGPRPSAMLLGTPSGYGWEIGDPAGYLAARDKALLEGLEPDSIVQREAGDVFPGRNRDELVRSRRQVGRGIEAVTEGLKRFYLTATDLEYEHTPDNLVRESAWEERSGRAVFDVAYRINSHGFRETAGDPGSKDVWLFVGDSFTFGAFLHGDETAAHHFSGLTGFSANVMNLGVMGWGPHHALRDLELDKHVGPAMAPGATVKGVVFGLIDTHADRAASETPKYMTAPSYRLRRDGGVEFRRRGADRSLGGILERSRVYPVLRERLSGFFPGAAEYKWRLSVALLAEMDRLCRDRYGVPLTVVYWDDNPTVPGMLREAGVEVIRIAQVLPEGEDWRDMSIMYLTCDGHPSGWANKLLARHLYARMAEREREGEN